jgi:hypothetical protein
MRDEMKKLLALTPQNSTTTPQTAESWIDAKAARDTLLYVSDARTGTVGVHSFSKAT